MEYKLIRSKRKSFGLEINKDGELLVRAPVNLKQSEIDRLLRDKKDWIEKKQKEILQHVSDKKEVSFSEGDRFLVWGHWYPLEVVINPKRHKIEIELKEKCIKIRMPMVNPEEVRKALEMWYRHMSNDFICKCVEHYDQCFSKSINNITIKEQKKRWGSCSSKGNLNFNWRLSMAPKAVCEYVVIHEMCHLVHMDHSKAYWKVVEQLDPNYKKHRKWLKENGHHMYWD